MKKVYDLAIIGGGAGGLFAGTIAGENGLSTIIIEKENKLGKKLLATGNGRCNIANMNFYDYCYNNPQYVKRIYEEFSLKDKLQNCSKPILDKLQQFGLSFYNDNEGRVYPISNSTHCVVSVLSNTLARFGVEIMLESNVKEISKKDDIFEIKLPQEIIKSKNVLLCCGGGAVQLAQELGHSTTPLKPSLTGLKTQQNFKKISGVRVHNATVNANFNNDLKKEFSPLVNIQNNIYSEKGEVTFKDDGISGICVMNVSAVIARQNKTPEIWLDLLPNISQEKIHAVLTESLNSCGIINKLYGWFAKPLAEYLFNNYKTPQLIANNIKHFSVILKGTYENNQVTCGGIKVNELTLTHSNKVSNLYLSGEMLDIDGVCGGYNLMFALASAGLSVKQILKNKE